MGNDSLSLELYETLDEEHLWQGVWWVCRRLLAHEPDEHLQQNGLAAQRSSFDEIRPSIF